MNLLSLVSTAVATAQESDFAQDESVRRAQAEAAAAQRALLKKEKEDREWKAFVDGFRNIPEDMSTREFTEAAEKLYASPRFDNEAQAVFQAAVTADPSKFFALTVRDYLRRHNDEVIATLYMTRFLSITATTAELDKGHQIVWAAKAALSVVAAAVDRAAEGNEKKSARGVLKQFCTLVLDRFPHLPTEFYNLLTHVEQIGDLRDPLSQRQVTYPSAREGAKEKQDIYPRNGHATAKNNGGAFKKPAPAADEATEEEVRAYMVSARSRSAAKPVATAPLGEQLMMKGIKLIPGSRQHVDQTIQAAAELAQVS
jgi:hypothetical protein